MTFNIPPHDGVCFPAGTRVRIFGVKEHGYTVFNGRTGTIKSLKPVILHQHPTEDLITVRFAVVFDVDDYFCGFQTLPTNLKRIDS